MNEEADWRDYENVIREHEQKLESIKFKKFTDLIGDFVEKNTMCIDGTVMYNNIKNINPLQENLKFLP